MDPNGVWIECYNPDRPALPSCLVWGSLSPSQGGLQQSGTEGILRDRGHKEESNCWKSSRQCGKTVPYGECWRCSHFAAGQCEGSLKTFLWQTLGYKTSGTAPPRFCSLVFALRKPLGSPHIAQQHSVGSRHPRDSPVGTVFQQSLRLSNSWGQAQPK